nr:hypothetical protein [Actinomycetota bacterium]
EGRRSARTGPERGDHAARGRQPGEDETLARSVSRANRFEAALGARRGSLPRLVTRGGALDRVRISYGVDAAADVVLCARLRVRASLLGLVGGACFFSRSPFAVAVGAALEAVGLLAASGSYRRLRLSGLPRPRRGLGALGVAALVRPRR